MRADLSGTPRLTTAYFQRPDDLRSALEAPESEPSIVGVSAHLLGIGRKP